jgi:hypothetical protein
VVRNTISQATEVSLTTIIGSRFSGREYALVLLNPAFACPPGQSSQGAPWAVMASWKVTRGGPPAILTGEKCERIMADKIRNVQVRDAVPEGRAPTAWTPRTI